MTDRDSDTLREEDGGGHFTGFEARPFLFLALECDRPSAGGARYALRDVEEVRFGRTEVRAVHRDPAAAGILTVGVCDRWMSAEHARIRARDGRFFFHDLGSTNGSLVDGVPAGSTELRDGATLTIGHTLFVFRSSLRGPPDVGSDLDASELAALPVALASLLPDCASALAALDRVARSSVSILLLGETGSGKELLARAAHASSGRRGRLVSVNCGALPEALVESQFFGHEKGAFSGAHRDALGFVRAADKGTLFLDEIGDMRRSSQAAVLRVLEEREVIPVGGVRPQRVDLQVIAATHRPLDSLVVSNEFRGDLLARLSGYRHTIPPLRKRREDIGLVIAALLREDPATGARLARGITPEAARLLVECSWPGNIRELRHALMVSAVLADGDVLRVHHLPEAVRTGATRQPLNAPSLFSEDARKDTRERLVAHLAAHRGNITAVAEAMRTSRSQVHRWLKRFQLEAVQFVPPRPQ